MEPDEQANLSGEQILGVIRRRAPWILICFLLVTGLAFAYSKHQKKKYTATAAVSFSNNPLAQQIAGLSTTSSNNLVAQQDSNLELLRLGGASTRTARLLGHGLTDEKVIESVSVSVKGETDVVSVSATSTSPALAAAIANTYTKQFVKEQQIVNRKIVKSALKVVNRQLARLSPAQRFGSDGLNLVQRAQTLNLVSELGYNNAEVAGEALVPASPSSPKTKRNTSLGALLGLLLGFGLAFLLERLDRRIREPGELQEIYSLPMVGVIPKSTALSRPGALPATEAEAFSLTRAHLRFFNIDRDVRTVVIASPAPGDGKTTISRHLAEAASRSGSHVLLIEVDLRYPTLARQLGIRSGPGVADVLIGISSTSEAIQSVDLQASPGEGTAGRTLDVLVAGAVLPPNPGELLESQAMSDLIGRARAEYDLVVIDTPPLTAVSDAFPLLTKVDGVVIVGRIGRSQRQAAERLQQILAGNEAPLLGVIANGVKASGLAHYPGESKPSSAVSTGDNDSTSDEFIPTVKV
jgi:capsular exopolysaccharide synthesis family protein